jgi:hypothetical protein
MLTIWITPVQQVTYHAFLTLRVRNPIEVGVIIEQQYQNN